jgi:hypothetical protein
MAELWTPWWTIVEVRAGFERNAQHAFQEAGYRIYAPLYRRELQPHGPNRKSVLVMRRVFPGLLFAQDWRGWPDQRQHQIAGVIRLMPWMGGVAKLSDEDVAKMMLKERTCDIDDIRRPPTNGAFVRDDIEKGDSVEMELHGHRIAGILEDLSEDGKSKISAYFMGAQRLFRDIDADVLKKVTA